MIKPKFKKNTEKSTLTSKNILNNFLREADIALDLENCTKDELNNVLKKLYFAARKSDGDFYKITSYRSMRFGIQRHISSVRNWDIISDKEFREANNVFENMLVKLKESGKGKIDHFEEIEPEDILKLYFRFDIESPKVLLHKVWFDLCLQLCRRGRENMRNMTKSTFAVGADATGRKFIYQVSDELDKNHGANDNDFDTISEGVLYEVPNHPLCPVKSFETYISHLNPEENSLWQRPKSGTQSTIWFNKVPMSEKSIGNLMAEMSKKYELSKRYTNHCVRVTSLQLLDDEEIPGRHIIRISGHKSESTIKTYARKLSSARKRNISDVFHKATGILQESSKATIQKNETQNLPAS